MTSFLLGVLSSIAAAVVCGLVVKVLIPSLRAALSDELDISGTWCAHFVTPAGSTHDGRFEVRQRFRKLDGPMVFIKHNSSTGATETKVYYSEGYLRDRFVTLCARNSSEQAVGAAVFLLEVVGDARLMRGRGVWYSITKKTIDQMEFEWKRTVLGSHS